MGWMEIIAAIALGAMVLYLLPRAKQMIANSPKAEKGDWQAVIIPILCVMGFVFLLVQMV
ncbi:MAG: hypothetical protein GXP14_04395 [Gammaproteobacteria bacterium]|nr:hypothetical protein [Gammaproteobacteria bacterium]